MLNNDAMIIIQKTCSARMWYFYTQICDHVSGRSSRLASLRDYYCL